MLLKVFDGEDGWVLFDNVDKVHLIAKTHEVSRATELSELTGGDALILVPKSCFKNNETVTIGIIEFESKEVLRKALFTNVVFVCDDRGNTIDRLNVRHGKANR
jgi:hypothetical protein